MKFKLCSGCEDMLNDSDVKCSTCGWRDKSKDIPIEVSVRKDVVMTPISKEEFEKKILEGNYEVVVDELGIFDEDEDAGEKADEGVSKKVNRKEKVLETQNNEELSKVLRTIFIKIAAIVVINILLINSGGTHFFYGQGLLGGLATFVILYAGITLLGFVWRISRNQNLIVTFINLVICYFVFLFVIVPLLTNIEEWIYSVFGRSRLVEEAFISAILFPPLIYDVIRVVRSVKKKRR